MPTPQEILQQTAALADQARVIAVFWHVVTLVGLALVFAHASRPNASAAATLSASPLVTATTLAISVENPFNALLLGVTTVALAILGQRLPSKPLDPAPRWMRVVGGATLVYALTYPHFVEIRGLRDLWFAPVGVVPCPSLALVLGLGLLAGGFGSRAWCLTAAGAAAFYAVFGIFRLGVWLDVGLLGAVVALTVAGLLTPRTSGSDGEKKVRPLQGLRASGT